MVSFGNIIGATYGERFALVCKRDVLPIQRYPTYTQGRHKVQLHLTRRGKQDHGHFSIAANPLPARFHRERKPVMTDIHIRLNRFQGAAGYDSLRVQLSESQETQHNRNVCTQEEHQHIINLHGKYSFPALP
jgi:hypothetical protein